MELNALFRRAVGTGLDFLRPPQHDIGADRNLSSAHVRRVIAMVRFVLKNLDKPILNAQVTQVTGLHENHALSLFSRTMHIRLKMFINRMRLMRARALLVESSIAVSDVAEQCGFTSLTQFYAQFRANYGMPPAPLRQHMCRWTCADRASGRSRLDQCRTRGPVGVDRKTHPEGLGQHPGL